MEVSAGVVRTIDQYLHDNDGTSLPYLILCAMLGSELGKGRNRGNGVFEQGINERERKKRERKGESIWMETRVPIPWTT